MGSVQEENDWVSFLSEVLRVKQPLVTTAHTCSSWSLSPMQL
jgi:hypothetical protein